MMGCLGSSWYYETPDTLEGALQHGLGRGAAWAEQRPGGADAVLACIRRDHRWWWHIDERPVYLARLVRDLAMPVGAVLDLLREEHGDDEDNTVANTLQVLVALGGGGDAVAVEGLRGYVRDGPRWVEALQALAGAWPVELWDDLLPVVQSRLDDAGILWGSRPWTGWAVRDERIAAAVTLDRLAVLRDDPMETPEVRAAATARLAA
jgi:hypothetical protein